jgi:hypothetical protein
MHGVHDMVVWALRQRRAPKSLVARTNERALEGKTRHHRAGRQNQHREQHHPGALMGVLERVMVRPRATVKGHEHQAPGIKGRHESGDD